VGYAQKTPLKGLRFESLEAAQAHLERWEERWADTRIHGTTKRQVAVMFAEEKPALGQLPLEPFRYYEYGERTVHLDGCVEVEAAYYSVPPGFIGQRVQVQWDELRVRILAPKTGQLLREHVRQKRGRHRLHEDDRPARTPRTTEALLHRARTAGVHLGALCQHIHNHEGEPGLRRILGVLSLAKKHGAVAADEAAQAALDLGMPNYRFVRRFLERRSPLPTPETGGSAHPPAQPLPQPHRPKNRRTLMNLVEVDRALRQLRLSGMADVLETRLRHAQTEKLAPLDLVSSLVSDELLRRQDRLLARRLKKASFRDPDRSLDSFDFDFNKKINRALVFDLATARFVAQHEDVLFLGPPGTGKSHLAQAIGRAAILQGHRVVYREAHTLHRRDRGGHARWNTQGLSRRARLRALAHH